MLVKGKVVYESGYSSSTCKILEFNLELIESNLNSSRVLVLQLTPNRDRARVVCRVEFEYHNTRLVRPRKIQIS